MPSLRVIKPVLAVFLAACVLLLGLAALSPALHERLCDDHAHDSDASGPASAGDHVCAVTLFAAGCDVAVIPSLCAPPTLHAEGVARFTELLLSRTLRGPERVCGPPARA